MRSLLPTQFTRSLLPPHGGKQHVSPMAPGLQKVKPFPTTQGDGGQVQSQVEDAGL